MKTICPFLKTYIISTILGLNLIVSKAGILLVNPSSTGPGTVLSSVTIADWTNSNAYITLQDALSAASSGDEIWVIAGTYKPTQNITNTSSGSTDKTNTFLLSDGVALYGGFAGTETILSSRDATTNITILSGDFNGNDVVSGSGSTLSFSNISENAYHAVVVNDPTSPTLIDGFTITGGYGNNTDTFLSVTDGNLYGAGLFSTGGGNNLTISFCTFKNNSISTSVSATGGGGIFINNGNPTITNCTISSNKARAGGGITNQQSNSIISNCIISDNVASAGGGGIYNISSANPTITNSVIFNNYTANLGGGMYDETGSSPILTNCLFVNNTSVNGGGAVYGRYTSLPVFNNCTFYGNKATGTSSTGGGLWYSTNSGGTINNCIFYNNSTPNNSSDSGIEDIYSQNSGASKVSLSYCILKDAIPITKTKDVTNNQSAYPSFIDTTNLIGNDNIWMTSDDGLTLKTCSPAIDAGTSASAPASDLTGLTRPQNSGYDIGAYEYSGSIPSVSITTASLPNGNENSLYNETINQTGFPETPVWNISNGNVPIGLTFGTGILNGTPHESGNFNFTVTATLGSCLVSETYNIFIDYTLPSVFTNFNVTRVSEEGVLLNWLVNNNKNKDFQIERSADGQSFIKIATINGGIGSFKYIDKNDKSNYYRIRLTNSDDTNDFTETIYVQGENKINIQFFPNPVTDHIQLQGNESLYFQAVITDTKGNLIGTFSGNLKEIEETINMYLQDFTDGIYSIRFLTQEGLSEVATFIKAR